MNEFEDKIDIIQEKKKRDKSFAIGFLVGSIMVLTTAIIAFTGFSYITGWDVRRALADAKNKDSKIINGSFIRKMEIIENMIDSYYLHDFTEEDVRNGAYDGMVAALTDKYSEYYSPEEYKTVIEGIEGVHYGIGAYIVMDTETELCLITEVMENSPAEKAGLQNNDLIYMVEGTSTYQMEASDVVNLIKGEEGTPVHLTIIRDEEEMEVDVYRGRVEEKTVVYEMMENDIGYIGITAFDVVTVDSFTDALATLKGQGAKGLIIDVRSNLGGSLDTVCEILRQLLPKGLIVYTEDKYGNRDEITCDGSKEIQIPLAVLTNEYSASASEILTGAIKDHGIGTIIGTKTYGKGVVQKLFPLTDGSALKLTISNYFTPAGVNIDGTGIEPDINVELDIDAYEKYGTDNQLERALEEVASKINN